MSKNTRIRPKSVKEVLRPVFTLQFALTVVLVAMIAIKSWSSEPDINKRRAEINKQISEEFNDCIDGKDRTIVGVHKCRPLKGGAFIWKI